MKQGKLKLIEFLFGYQKRSYSTFRLITTYDLCLITLEVKVKIVSAKTQSKIWRIFGITTRLMTSRTGSNFSASCIQNRNFQTCWMLFFLQSGSPMWTYLPMGSRSKDIGYSLTLETVSWIIQQLKHHFALNAEIPNRFSENLFHISNCSRKQPEAIFRYTLKNQWQTIEFLELSAWPTV